MATQQKNPIYKFEETQRRPTLGAQLSHVSTQPTDTIVSMTSEIKGLKQAQQHMSVELKLLMKICNKIGESVTEVKDKLSQYDIDGDDVSNAEESDESDEDDVNESADESESQHNEDDADDMEEDESTNNAIDGSGVDMVMDTKTNGEPEKNSDHKPKRKYTKRVKK
jgi:hypothetical protein